MTQSGWIGVDLDGTLAKYSTWNNGQIGDPIPAMVERVKKWLLLGAACITLLVVCFMVV